MSENFQEIVDGLTGNDAEGNKLKMLGFADVPNGRAQKPAEDQRAIPDDTHYAGVDAKELSDMTIASHKAVYISFLDGNICMRFNQDGTRTLVREKANEVPMLKR